MKLRSIGLLLASAGALMSCGEGNMGPVGNNSVNVEDNAFDPSSMTVSVGTTVTWDWQGSNEHDVTFVDATSGAANPPVSNRQITGTFSVTFNDRGTFDYICSIHIQFGMTGSVTVE